MARASSRRPNNTEKSMPLVSDSLGRNDFEFGLRVLTEIFGNVNSQLQFAEAKNAALLTVNTAVIIGLGAVLASDEVQLHTVKLWLFCTSFALAGGALVALVSILPIFGPERHKMTSVRQVLDGNLFFFGDIHGASPKAYASAVFKALDIAHPPAKLHEDMANQIVINSGIANRKFAIFKLAAVMTATAAVAPVAGLVGLCIFSGGTLY